MTNWWPGFGLWPMSSASFRTVLPGWLLVVLAFLAHVVAAFVAEVFVVWGVPGSRRFCVCAALASVDLGRRKAHESRSQNLDSSFACHFQTCMSPTDRHRFVSDVLHGRCTSHAAPGGTNSCVMLHGNSSGWIPYGNSRVERGHEDHRESKAVE